MKRSDDPHRNRPGSPEQGCSRWDPNNPHKGGLVGSFESIWESTMTRLESIWESEIRLKRKRFLMKNPMCVFCFVFWGSLPPAPRPPQKGPPPQISSKSEGLIRIFKSNEEEKNVRFMGFGSKIGFLRFRFKNLISAPTQPHTHRARSAGVILCVVLSSAKIWIRIWRIPPAHFN